jgi:hypothetical protein
MPARKTRKTSKNVVTLPAVMPRRLNVTLAAAYLGVTVWRMRSLGWDNTVPSFIDGQRLLFDIRDLDAYADSVRGAA